MFVLGMASVTWAYFVSQPVAQKAATGFTLTSKMSFTPSGSNASQITGSRVRYQKSDGSFKQITTYLKPDGALAKTVTLLGMLGRGVFEFTEGANSTEFLSPMRLEMPLKSEAEIRETHHHNKLRDEVVQGYKTLVVRLAGETPNSFTELYHAFALQDFPIKTVSVTDAGVLTIEPTKIEFGEPSDNDLAFPNLPVSYERFEQKIQALEESGRHDTAETMRRQLLDAKRP
jgi:hypothetical protein